MSVLVEILAVGFCLYTYVLFPLLLHVLASRRPLPTVAEPGEWPTVSVVIAAHNEAHNLPGKLTTLDNLDYPRDKLQCVIVSDGSSDDTPALLKAAAATRPQLTVRHYPVAAGKPTALNIGVSKASGELVVFMDARQHVSADAIKLLVSHLQDPAIGAVSGALDLIVDRGTESSQVGLYWRYERWIRQNESRLFSTTGATGALYAIRRADFEPLDPDTLLDDFDTPIRLLLAGKRTLFVPEARVFDQAESDAAGEFRRKVRTLAGNFQSFRRFPALFDPSRNPVWWQFVSHKVFRLLVPYALLIAFFASAASNSTVLQGLFVLQIAFYGLGIGASVGLPGCNNRFASFAKVFLQLNMAAVVGAIAHWRGSASVTWRRSRS